MGSFEIIILILLLGFGLKLIFDKRGRSKFDYSGDSNNETKIVDRTKSFSSSSKEKPFTFGVPYPVSFAVMENDRFSVSIGDEVNLWNKSDTDLTRGALTHVP